MTGKKIAVWPVYLLALPAFVAIWSGWVGLGQLAGFGAMNLLPGITEKAVINTAITLPIGMETYAAYALRVWMAGGAPARARGYARWTAISSLIVGSLGQVGYHLMAAAGWTAAPWPVVVLVSCVPVAVLGMGAGLVHLVRGGVDEDTDQVEAGPVLVAPVPDQVVTTAELWDRYSDPVELTPTPEARGFVRGSSELEPEADQADDGNQLVEITGVDQVAARRRSDDELWHVYGDELCRAWIVEDGLTRYRVEQVTDASRRQAERILTRVQQTVERQPEEVSR